MNEYRVTRRVPYCPNTPGAKDLASRNGHYILAESEQQALLKMATRFPDDVERMATPFDVQLWRKGVA